MKKYLCTFLALLLLTVPALAAGAAEAEEEGVPVPTPAEEAPQGAWSVGEDAPADWVALPVDGEGRTPWRVDENGKLLSAGDLYDYWQHNDWPETVGYAWSADGTADAFVVAVVNGDEAAIEDIKAMMVDPSCLTFTACKYSYAQLEQTMEELEARVKGERVKCIVSFGIGVRDNDFSVNGQPCVKVGVNDEAEGSEEWIAYLTRQYGNLLELELGGPIVSETTGIDKLGRPVIAPGGTNDIGGLDGLLPEQTVPAAPAAWYVWALPLLAAGLLAALTTRRALALRTADGSTRTAGGRPSRAQTEAAVRESAAAPGEDAWRRLTDRLEQ